MASATRLICSLLACSLLNNSEDSRMSGRVVLAEDDVPPPLPPSKRVWCAAEKPDMHVCAKGICLCCDNNATAECSYHSKAVTKIPHVPETVRSLHFSSNDLRVLLPGSFESAPNLVILDLSSNNLHYLDKTSLARLTHLQMLSLESNSNLRLSEVTKALSAVPSLRRMNAKDCNILLPTQNAFQGILRSQLQVFILSFIPTLTLNGELNMTQFNVFSQLTELDLGYGRIRSIEYDGSMGLETLLLDSNPLDDFLVTCNGNVSLYPHLRFLTLKYTHIQKINVSVCLPALETLDLSDTRIMFIRSRMLNFDRFPVLIDLNLGFNSVSEIYPFSAIGDYAFQNPNLKILSIVRTKLKFWNKNIVYNAAFADCPNLTVLNLTDNVFMDLKDARFHLLFGHLTTLTTLRLDQCAWNRISASTFTPFRRLSVLSLSENRFVSIPDGAFDSLQHLTHLDLSGNRLGLITRDTFSPQLRSGLFQLALNKNPFMCTCDLEWFSSFISTHHSIFNLEQTSYDCTNLQDTEVAEFPPNQQMCLLNQQASVLIIFTCSSVIVTLTSVILVLRFRWHIRLVLYEAFRGRGANNRRIRLQANNFDWDVFVSYASEDLPWVRQHLMPELEDRLGLRLCVHERDFIPGKNIVDNIVDCVESSKKILMVFSRDFVRSQWCQFELALCLSHVMDHDDVLIIVCVDDVISRRMTPAMMAVLKTTTYIQWVENDDAVRSFWGRLDQSLYEITDRRVAEDAV